MASGAAGVDEVWDEWRSAVNLTPKQLEGWLETEESQSVGDTSGGGEATGHKEGRRIVAILQTKKHELTEDDVKHMHKVVGYVKRHSAQRPSGDVEHTRWRYSLMNWGHDPLKD